MDLTGLAAPISTAQDLLPALVARWQHEPDSDPTQQRIKEVTRDSYPNLGREIDDGCMKILLHLEDGRNCQPKLLVLEVHPRAEALSSSAADLLLDEFRYRLEFMQALGFLEGVRGGGYSISHLGKAFVRVSRDERDYPNILFHREIVESLNRAAQRAVAADMSTHCSRRPVVESRTALEFRSCVQAAARRRTPIREMAGW
jgi:hypothetical protein